MTNVIQDLRSSVAEQAVEFAADQSKAEVTVSTDKQPNVGQAFCTISKFPTFVEALKRFRAAAADDRNKLLFLDVRDMGKWRLSDCRSVTKDCYNSLRPICEVKRKPGDPLPALREFVPCYVRVGHGKGRIEYEEEHVFSSPSSFEEALATFRMVLLDPETISAALYVGSPLKGEEDLRFCKSSVSFLPGQ